MHCCFLRLIVATANAGLSEGTVENRNTVTHQYFKLTLIDYYNLVSGEISRRV